MPRYRQEFNTQTLVATTTDYIGKSLTHKMTAFGFKSYTSNLGKVVPSTLHHKQESKSQLLEVVSNDCIHKCK